VREHGQEAVQLAVDPQVMDYLCAVGLQPAVDVVQGQARDGAREAVEDAREDAARPRILAAALPAGDEVEALVELREQARDLGGVVLEIGVDRDDDLAPRLLEAGREKFRRRRTTRTFSCASWRRVSAANVPSVEPSSTKMTSQGVPSGSSAAWSSSNRRATLRSSSRAGATTEIVGSAATPVA
jgi:DNA-binding NarL/FixJ family response regulator